MSRRKDQERFARLKAQNSRYQGFRGAGTRVEKPVEDLESVVCSVCNRKRNVPVTTLPDDRAGFVCRVCQVSNEEQATATTG